MLKMNARHMFELMSMDPSFSALLRENGRPGPRDAARIQRFALERGIYTNRKDVAEYLSRDDNKASAARDAFIPWKVWEWSVV